MFNCCFYNFFLENNFLFFKIIDTKNNFFFLFFVKFFKRKKLKIKKKKKFFKYKKKKFKFKKLRRHLKFFKFKKSSIKNEKIMDLNFTYFFNYLIKSEKSKKLKLNQKKKFSQFFYNLEFFSIKKKINFNLFLSNNYNYNFYKNLKNINNFYFRFLKSLFFFKKPGSLIFFKKTLFKVSLKTKIFSFDKTVFSNFFLKQTKFFKDFKKFCFKKKLFFINFLIDYLFFNFFLIFSNFNMIRSAKIKSKKKLRRKKNFFYKRTKFFKLKKKYKYKTRYVFFNKLNIKKNKSLLHRKLYKLILVNLINNFRMNFSFFNFNSLNRHSFYLYFFLRNQKKYFNTFFKKNLFFFDFLKKKNNVNSIYNNQYPVYNSNKILLKSFKKVFKSHFNKKFNNYLYFYIIPLFEYFFNKNVFIKSINSNIFKKPKLKKKFLVRKLLKIYKKNKFSILSRSITFNLYEIIEVILYAFYYKDIFILSNWFLKNFRNVHFTNHKNFLVFFKTIINDIFESYRDIFQVKGFYFIIKGKVGVTSNAKKKTIKFAIGSSNKSKKSQRMDFQQGVVKSLSGSLGVSMILTY